VQELATYMGKFLVPENQVYFRFWFCG